MLITVPYLTLSRVNGLLGLGEIKLPVITTDANSPHWPPNIGGEFKV